MKYSFQNILVVRTDRIGDVILTLPAVHALREAYPQARMTMLVAGQTEELLQDHTALNSVMVDDRLGSHRGVLGFWRLVKEVRKKNFDLAVIFHTKKRTNQLCFFAGIPRRLGYKDNKMGFLLTDPVNDQRAKGVSHESEYCLRLLNKINIQSEIADCSITVRPEAEHWVNCWLDNHHIKNNKPLIAIHPGASDKTKMWPADLFAELIQALNQKDRGMVILIGAGQACQAAREILSLCPEGVIDLTGRTSVSQMVAVLKKSQLLISNDSGPVHVASAVGTPVISIFTRNQAGINPERWRPLGAKSAFLAPDVQEDLSFASGKLKNTEYLREITVKQILEAVDAVFKLC